MGLFDKKYDSKKNETIIDSFKHAYDGIKYTVLRERNMHIHLTVALLVIIFGILFNISIFEWITCFILFAIVISLELVNTAIESVVDLVTTKDNNLAKLAKDAAAGAVFFSSVIAAVIGLIIFIPKIVLFFNL